MGTRAMARGCPRSVVSAGLVSTFAVLLMGAAVAAATPAAAVEDPTRPDARVTHGPSCRPGGLVVEIAAGTTPYFVRLATTRQPAGEDEATLQPGATVTLRTDDVDWGETIDGRLEYEARDGSGVTFVDELETYSFTRPTREDCEAVTSPSPAQDGPVANPAPAPSTTRDPAAEPTASTGSTGPASGAPTGSATTSSSAGVAPLSVDPPHGPARQVDAGDTVTLQGAGFLPGERVTVSFHGSEGVLASATAGPDGTVQIEVRIPGGTAAGPTTVDLVGDRSAVVADVELRVAALGSATGGSGLGHLVPLVAAAAALVGSAAGLVSVAGRQRATERAWRAAAPSGWQPMRSA